MSNGMVRLSSLSGDAEADAEAVVAKDVARHGRRNGQRMNPGGIPADPIQGRLHWLRATGLTTVVETPGP